MEKSFKSKIVLITGASSGIGHAAAKTFASQGADLLLTGRNESVLIKLNEELKEYNGRYELYPGDLTDKSFRQGLINHLLDTFERLDVLINAAGIIGSGTIENTSLDEYDRMMDINLRTVFHLTQLAVPHIKKTKGNIVNVGSVTGTRAFPGILSYCVSKAGLDQLTRVLALELAKYKVRVNSVNPGVVETNLHLNSGMDSDNYRKFLKRSETTHPLGRVGQADEIANLISFLASENAGWITGITCNIDGGRHLTCAR